MTPPTATPTVRPLRAAEAARIASSCSHAHVPPAPAAWGYRYVDLGGDTPPFYVRRFTVGKLVAAVTLAAPLERTTGDDAEPGAHAVARVGVTLGARRVAWPEVLGPHGAHAPVADLVLDELAGLDLLQAGACPICSSDGP
jgi:hypothetical protein